MLAKNVSNYHVFLLGFLCSKLHVSGIDIDALKVDKQVIANEYLSSSWQINPFQLLSQRSCGFYFQYQDSSCLRDQYLLFIHPIKNKDCDWLRPCGILNNNRSVADNYR